MALHLAVLLFGAAGLFGKLLSLPPLWIVMGRCGFAALTLGAVLVLRGTSLMPPTRREAGFFLILGLILAFHWGAFFHAIQISSVALGVITFATFPLFTTLLEPLFFRERMRAGDVAGALVMFAGLVLVVPEFSWGSQVNRGFVWGVLSGFSFALLSVLNRRGVQRQPALVITFYQMLVATLVLMPIMVWQPQSPGWYDLGLMVVLGCLCTALAHFLFVYSMGFVSAQLASMVACLEAVYGVLFAYLLLNEVPGGRTLAGGALILVTALAAVHYRRPPIP